MGQDVGAWLRRPMGPTLAAACPPLPHAAYIPPAPSFPQTATDTHTHLTLPSPIPPPHRAAQVKGKRLDTEGGVRTRARARTQAEQWSSVPLRVKIVVLLTDAYVEATTQGGWVGGGGSAGSWAWVGGGAGWWWGGWRALALSPSP